VSFLAVTLPASILLAAALLWLVVRAAREGQWDDWEGPAWRHLFDDDRVPEAEAPPSKPAGEGSPSPRE
jgi:cbb3-type cytochrome oxidase maturation protein